MTKIFTELQSKYLEGVDAMSETDARAFLELLRSNEDMPFREDRIPKLERHLANIERKKQAALEWDRTWKAAAREYGQLTERWLSLGANWRPVGTALTVWEYEGERFYEWWSGRLITETIEDARKADRLLDEIIQRKKATE